ncbi:uS10/mL48 family ribosomal protein [Halopenitus persicus]|jgi:ribosomal protein S10|uniref:uS10/mL48 family ribosomal protein n=1 Tax=Halopenitus persicus TaxID=1048396 RepID=UPI000BBA756D|nr:uS10/mL48 family ribosomal protein [Halopenitus persicus]
MTFVTKLSFESGDRRVLEETVEDLHRTLERKGVECKGPHAFSPERTRVQLYKQLRPGDQFSPWEYTVYARKLEIHGSDDIAREMVDRDFPDSVHVEVEVDRKKPLGHGRD